MGIICHQIPGSFSHADTVFLCSVVLHFKNVRFYHKKAYMGLFNMLCKTKQKQLILYCAVPENIHTPSTEGLWFCPPLHLPPGNSALFSYITPKNFAFKTPLPLGISSDLPWGGYGFFLELHIFPSTVKALSC